MKLFWSIILVLGITGSFVGIAGAQTPEAGPATDAGIDAGVTAPAPTPDSDYGDLLSLVLKKLSSKQFLWALGLIMIVVVKVLRSPLAKKFDWFGTKWGGRTLAGVVSLLAVFGASLGSGSALSADMVLTAFGTALTLFWTSAGQHSHATSGK